MHWRKSDLPERVPTDHTTLLKNALIWTGESTGEENGGTLDTPVTRQAFEGYVLLHGNAIADTGVGDPDATALSADEIIDCSGLSIIPGLVEGHAHPSFENIVHATDPGDVPPEEGVLLTLRNCERLLDAGFTSAFSAASARIRLDVVARNWINQGRAPGPRLLAASPEITSTGCLGDFSALHQHRDSFGLVADGEDELRKAVRLCIREGCDTIKINIGGDLIPTNMLNPAKDDIATTYSDKEVEAACDEARRRGARVAAHCRGSGDVRLALKHGVNVIYHLDFAYRDPAIIEAVIEAKERVFLSPAVGLMDALAPDGIFGLKGEDAVSEVGILLDAQKKTYPLLREGGVRVVIGGDYGFAATPQGTNGNDLELYCVHFGYSPEEALVCGTRTGGELMELPVGQLRKGWLADLLVVEGRPWESPKVLQTEIGKDGNVFAPRIKAIVQNGWFHKKQL